MLVGLCHRQWAIINCVETVKRTRHKATMLVARVSNMSDSNDSVSLEEVGWSKPSMLLASLFCDLASPWPDGLHVTSVAFCPSMFI